MEEKKVARWDSHPETNQGLLVEVDEDGVMIHPGKTSGHLSTDKVEELHSLLGDYLAAVPRKVTVDLRDVRPNESFEWLDSKWCKYSGSGDWDTCVGPQGYYQRLSSMTKVMVTRKGSQ